MTTCKKICTDCYGHIENGIDLNVVEFSNLLWPLLIPMYNPDAFLFLKKNTPLLITGELVIKYIYTF